MGSKIITSICGKLKKNCNKSVKVGSLRHDAAEFDVEIQGQKTGNTSFRLNSFAHLHLVYCVCVRDGFNVGVTVG